MGFNRNCGQCAYPGLNGGICPFFQEPRGTGMEVCPRFTIEITMCETCGRPVIRPEDSVLMADCKGEYRTICNNCAAALKTCNGCQNVRSCAFENDPSPTPKYIQKQFQQGNQVILTTVKNETRVKELCEGKCQCFDSEGKYCRRENNWCENLITILQNCQDKMD